MSSTQTSFSKDFIFNSYKREKKAKLISTIVDAVIGLLLTSLCLFLMSMSAYA